MTMVPGSARLPSKTEPAGSQEAGPKGLHPRHVAARFAELFARRAIDVHPREVRRMAARFCASEHARVDDLEAYVLAYADPTGETAVRNVARERRRA